jgi:hypothetical protein
MEMKHTGLFKMHSGPDVLDRDTMKYWMDKVEFAKSLPETKRILKKFEDRRRYLVTLSHP